MMRSLLSTILLFSSVMGYSNTNQILATQQAQLAKVQRKAEHHPEIDLLKLWIANRTLGNVWDPADGGSLDVSIENGVVTLQTPVGSHHSMVGLVKLEAGTYRVDVVAVPSTITHNWPDRSNSQTKTASFYARVGKVIAEVPAIETANYMKPVNGTFNGTTSSSRPLTTALTFSSTPGALESGTHEVWISFNPYVGAKKLQIVSAVLRRVE